MITPCLLSLSSCVPVWDCLPPFTYNHIFCMHITVSQHSKEAFFRALNGTSNFQTSHALWCNPELEPAGCLSLPRVKYHPETLGERGSRQGGGFAMSFLRKSAAG